MYCELGGMYVGRSMRLGHEKEVVIIVSGEGEYVRRSMRLGHENAAVCMGCMWGDRGVRNVNWKGCGNAATARGGLDTA